MDGQVFESCRQLERGGKFAGSATLFRDIDPSFRILDSVHVFKASASQQVQQVLHYIIARANSKAAGVCNLLRKPAD